MIYFNSKKLQKMKWKPATYYYEKIGNWYISEYGLMYNKDTGELRHGKDNVKGKDKHQRISIKHRLYYISRIVAEAFVKNDNPAVNKIVRHMDDDPYNNHYSNLKWGTPKENTMDAIRNKKIVYDENRKYTRCENHPHAILTNKDVNKIIKMLNKSKSLKSIAKKFSVDVDVIRHIYKGNSWRPLTEKHLPFPKQGKERKSSKK